MRYRKDRRVWVNRAGKVVNPPQSTPQSSSSGPSRTNPRGYSSGSQRTASQPSNPGPAGTAQQQYTSGQSRTNPAPSSSSAYTGVVRDPSSGLETSWEIGPSLKYVDPQGSTQRGLSYRTIRAPTPRPDPQASCKQIFSRTYAINANPPQTTRMDA